MFQLSVVGHLLAIEGFQFKAARRTYLRRNTVRYTRQLLPLLFVIADLFLEVPYDNGCLCKEENQVGQDSIVILEKEEVDVVVDKEQVQHKHQKCLEEPVLGEEDLQFVSLEIYGTGEGKIEGIVDGAEDQND